METIEATFKVVTPMFMSGAEQDKAELRLASIKGALRFWWRALAWERLQNLQKIREEEAQLFGSTDRQAAVLMKLEHAYLKTETADVSESSWKPSTWRHYTGYGLVTKKTKTNPQAREKREYIKAQQQFSLILMSRSAETITQVTDALKLLGLIGGLGARSRNGWGSVTLAKLEKDARQMVLWKAPADIAALHRELQYYFQARQNRGSYTSLSNSARFTVGPLFDHPEDAHAELSEIYKEFLSNMRDDEEKRQREGFGLPRNINLRSSKYDKKDVRRTGSVFLHVHQFADSTACPVVAVLPAQFLEEEYEPEGGWAVAFDFLDYFNEEVNV